MSNLAQTGTRAGGVLAATCISTLVVNANTSAVSILLPAISEDTGMSVDTLQWAVTGYSLVGAAVIVTSGSLGDVFGRKRVFQLGLLLFVASCVMIALAQSGGMVIAGRMIQGAAGATILACGLSLLSVANDGDAQLRAVSLWGAAAAVGAAAGPLARRGARRPHRVAGAVLDRRRRRGALHGADLRDRERVARPGPAAVDRLRRHGADRADPDAAHPRGHQERRLGLALGGHPGLLRGRGRRPGSRSCAVEGRVAVPLLDLALLRNRVLVGSTIAILIGAGTINGLMYLLSLYFQNPAALDFSPLAGGPGHAPGDGRARRGRAAGAEAGGQVRRPADHRRRVRPHHPRLRRSWASSTPRGQYGAFLLPLVAIAVGMGMSNGPASSAATASVPENQVGGASGVSNMARYVGAAVATALAATIYGSVITNQTDDGATAVRRAGLRARRGLVDDGGLQLPRRPDGLRDRPAPRGHGHLERRGRGIGRAHLTRCRPRRRRPQGALDEHDRAAGAGAVHQ